MTKNATVTIAILFLLAFCRTVIATDDKPSVTVQWQNPERYSDVLAAHENQFSYQALVFRVLGRFIERESAELLRPGYKLVVVIHNLDLAGELRISHLRPGYMLRVIEEPSTALMDIGYRLEDSTGKTVGQGRKVVRGPRAQRVDSRLMRTQSFYFEKQMIQDWLERELKPKLACL